jgi:hypothetical protein
MVKQMKTRQPFYFLLGLIFILLSACGGREKLSIPTDLMEPQSLESHLVFIDKTLHNAYLIDVRKNHFEPTVTSVELPPQPFMVEKRKGDNANELLILCAGQQDTEEQEESPAALAVLQDDGKTVRKYSFERGFNSFIQSEDGKYAFIFFSESTGKSVEINDLPTMKQKVIFIDLEEQPSADPIPSRLLDNLVSDVPTGVDFSPLMTIAGKQRRLAVVHSTSLVWLIDLTTPDAAFLTVEPERDEQFSFEQVLFDSKEPRLYLRGTSSQSIYYIDLVATTDTSSKSDFTAVVEDPRIVGAVPSDMALYTVDKEPFLLVVSASSIQAFILDTNSSDTTTVPIQRGANRILIFSSDNGSNSSVASPMALVYNQNADFSTVSFIDVAKIDLSGTDTKKSESVETVSLDSTFNHLEAVPNKPYALLTNANSKQISILNLMKRTINPIETSFQMTVIADSRSNKLWFGNESGERLGYLDLDTFMSGDVRLDSTIEYVLLIGTTDQPKIAVVHPSSIGYVTVLDAVTPSRKTAESVEGFFVSKLLDRGER